jgi:hypothetical protein
MKPWFGLGELGTVIYRLRPDLPHKVRTPYGYYVPFLIGLLAFCMLSSEPVASANGKSKSYDQAIYEHEIPHEKETYPPKQHKYTKSHHYDIYEFFHYWWNWLWYNLILIVIVGIIVWIIFRFVYWAWINVIFFNRATALAAGTDLPAPALMAQLAGLRADLPL